MQFIRYNWDTWVLKAPPAAFEAQGQTPGERVCYDRYMGQIPRGLPDADAEEKGRGPEGT